MNNKAITALSYNSNNHGCTGSTTESNDAVLNTCTSDACTDATSSTADITAATLIVAHSLQKDECRAATQRGHCCVVDERRCAENDAKSQLGATCHDLCAPAPLGAPICTDHSVCADFLVVA
jgi:hypothetical protein